MRTILGVATFAALLVAGQHAPTPGGSAVPASRPDYDLTVQLDPDAHLLEVSARVSGLSPDVPLEFLLGGTLEVLRSSPPVERVPLGDTGRFSGINGAVTTPDARRVARYRALAPARDGVLTIVYRGRIDDPLSAQKEEYSRGFRETSGQIGPQGIYLSGATYWYPYVGPDLLTFSLQAEIPPGWHVVSQGDGASRDETGRARWRTTAPMDEIYLVGGPLRVWRDRAGAVETLVYLHEDDGATAARYLTATAQYLEMYRSLIAPYPYSKFALVENFWETGYGMPSFTLLGPSIIRFPFILASSYPHEILHNWWGNSVFVDYQTGNWSEGLTAYLADHLIQEQRGLGADHRRATLQKYASYVKAERDFPLTEFRSRESAATEAVGYGKTLMGMHMLRLRLGDEGFRRFLASFYREFRGQRASFRDLQRTAEAVAGESLATYFDDLITKTGAPILALDAHVTGKAGDYVVRGTIRQIQPGPPFSFEVPLALQVPRGTLTTRVRFEGREAGFELRSGVAPLAVHLDPAFDVFRMLDPHEIPPSIGQIFGASRVVAVLPSAAAPVEQKAWRDLVEGWRTESHHVEVVTDEAFGDVPADAAVWVLGRENRLVPSLFLKHPGIGVEADALLVDGQRVPFAGHAAVVTVRHPTDSDKAIGWIVNSVPEAFPGLGRKLPHYGRYSYLGFEGEEPTNTIKGEWPTSDSPLSLDLRPASARAARLPPLPLEKRKPLIDLPPIFSQKALAEHVAWLASPDRGGRGIGTSGLQQSADYIAAQFKAARLTPGGDNGSWFQAVPVDKGPDGRPSSTVNVIGYLPGSTWQDQAALVAAHYDHLGRGWPDAHAEDAGVVHPGADDNASGVAVLLELARVFAAGDPPPRSLVFIAFSAEEAGLQGARTFASHPLPVPLEKVIGLINLDTVGRLGAGKVSILGAGTATEWPHIFRGASFVTGVESVSVPGNAEASDQRVFIERGVPAVQVFTGPHADYHRPGDTADKVDTAGLVKVATLVREALAYLSERPGTLTATLGDRSSAASQATPDAGAAGQRRVSFGAVPDFAYQGTGVRLADVVAGSPAAQVGLKAGDVITGIDGSPIASLQQFSSVLRALQPGQRITVVFVRGGKEESTTLAVVAR